MRLLVVSYHFLADWVLPSALLEEFFMAVWREYLVVTYRQTYAESSLMHGFLIPWGL